jgi:hypothetical protein
VEDIGIARGLRLSITQRATEAMLGCLRRVM